MGSLAAGERKEVGWAKARQRRAHHSIVLAKVGTLALCPPYEVASGILLARHQRTEQLPAPALETHHLQLLQRREVGRASLDLGARQIDADLEIEIGGLLHHVLAGAGVAAWLQNLLKSLGDAVGEYGGGIVLIAFGIPFGHERPPFVHGEVV